MKAFTFAMQGIHNVEFLKGYVNEGPDSLSFRTQCCFYQSISASEGFSVAFEGYVGLSRVDNLFRVFEAFGGLRRGCLQAALDFRWVHPYINQCHNPQSNLDLRSLGLHGLRRLKVSAHADV